jgi:MEMO1 family protein
MIRRKAAVAGQFYPGNARDIKDMIAGLVEPGAAKERVLGAMAPHAGWVYSGKGAGRLYSRLEIPETVVVMCPNHRGAGAEAAIMVEGTWDLPTGEVALAPELARRIMARCDFLQDDARAHQSEHSLEVHLPLLQHFQRDLKLVPITLSRVSYGECEQLGRALADAITDYGQEVLVIASSDMTHFESAESVKKKDDLALERLLALDPRGLYDVVLKNRITMCGFIPATVMLLYALARGATTAELVDYRNSGDVTGDYSEVVAYAAVTVK